MLELLLFIPFFLSIQSTTSAVTYRFHICTNSTSFPPNTTYHTNLNHLLSTLTSNATNNGGFYNSTTGSSSSSQSQDTAYGLFLCRGDVTPATCQDCVSKAGQDLVKTRCPNVKEAVIWYDECMVRYSNRYIFSKLQMWPHGALHNTKNASDPKQLSKLVKTAMTTMVSKAAVSDNSGKKFATNKTYHSDFDEIYNLIQCTPDLTVGDCSSCLQKAIANVSTDHRGYRVMTPSCNVRFEFYQFYENPSTSLAVSPSPSSTPASLKPAQGDPEGKKRTFPKLMIAVPACVVSAALLFTICFCCYQRKKKYQAVILEENGIDFTDPESLKYDLRTLQAATENFSNKNKLGEGGFGVVYKGRLENGREIAVKRLSTGSGQGAREFKNEVVLVAKLQHRNLVRLLGFCVAGNEKLLVYEFVSNKSLDYFIFDAQIQGRLDWTTRYKIIGGIAQGMLYLHDESQLRVIHRDLKASNVLLGLDMHPKISDFGMARIFDVDQTQADTNRIVGTYGYMSPEYAMHGHFSLKSDVFSFGVLLLEIISGKRNTSFYMSGYAEDLLSYAWKLWKESSPLELVDSALRASSSMSSAEVIRCIHIALLCVEEDEEARPSMASVVLMLNSMSTVLPAPRRPGFFASNTSTGNRFFQISISTSKSNPSSSNDPSITEIQPR